MSRSWCIALLAVYLQEPLTLLIEAKECKSEKCESPGTALDLMLIQRQTATKSRQFHGSEEELLHLVSDQRTLDVTVEAKKTKKPDAPTTGGSGNDGNAEGGGSNKSLDDTAKGKTSAPTRPKGGSGGSNKSLDDTAKGKTSAPTRPKGGSGGSNKSLDDTAKGKTSAPTRIANTSTVIKAPLEIVWRLAIVNMANWSAWNEVFDSKISGTPELGKKFNLKSNFPDAPIKETTIPMQISDLFLPPEDIGTKLGVATHEDYQKKQDRGKEESAMACWTMDNPWVPKGVLWAKHCLVFSKTFDGSTHLYNWEDQGGSMVGMAASLMGKHVQKAFEDWNEALRKESERLFCDRPSCRI
eukprot:TRINITY_DN4899_c0_g2_i1.p1 TRINITY_DN4899_c0_g2~~TRINITY_DN4899_c0_g2_i1.p1  ORF type:complete len:355 (+),score=78.55 TRINITY_DN4899_c0_g2_i1:102-1166(+)